MKRNTRILKEDMVYVTSVKLPWERFKGKTIIVTGANGLIPAYIIETFIALNRQKNLGIRIIGITRNKEKAIEKFDEYIKSDQLELIIQDVCKSIVCNEKVDFILHAASQASPKYFGVDPVNTLMANTIGTYNLLELAKEKQVESFLFFSSSEVYGKNDKIPITEADFGYLDPMIVRNCYAESKRMAETMCISWFHQFGVPVKIVRPFHTYGPGMNLNDGRVFADFVSDVVYQRDIVLKSSGNALRTFCYLADAIVGFFTVLLNGKNGEAYNIGNDMCEIRIRDLAKEVVNLFPEFGLKVKYQKRRFQDKYIESDVNRAYPDISKIRKLGWEPKFLIHEGFKRTIESYL